MSVDRWGKGTLKKLEQDFLKGPIGRVRDLLSAFRIFGEFLYGVHRLHKVGPCVTVFGSARFEETNRYYQLARDMGSQFAKWGVNVITGGGPGIMEAANRGAKEGGGYSIGCNIRLPMEQKPNPYLDVWLEFHYFFVRKVMLVKYSHAFVVMPGGFGTLDELFETATLIQTGIIKDFPIVLMGSDYWQPLKKFIVEALLKNETIDTFDLNRIFLTDSPQEAIACIASTAADKFGLSYAEAPKHCRLFPELAG
jgi:uncharacterized protein (TIGR00730 family)